jgi:energy-converting hydrogenase Eha subunit F
MWKRVTASLGVGAALALRGAIMKSVVSIMALILLCCTTPVAHAYPQPGTPAITACQAIRGYHRDGVPLSQIDIDKEAQTLMQSHQGNAVIYLGEARYLIKRAINSYYLGTDDMCA